MRYLRARRQEGLISVIAWFSLVGIALGVATLIIVMSVMNGFRQELLSRILGVNGHLSVYGVESSLVDYDRLSSQVTAVKGVVKVTPMIEGQVMASANGQATGALVRGLKPADLRARAILAQNIQYGDIDDFRGPDSVLIGTRLARKLGRDPPLGRGPPLRRGPPLGRFVATRFLGTWVEEILSSREKLDWLSRVPTS